MRLSDNKETVILVNCYSKSEKDTLTSKEKAMYKEFIKEIGKELRKCMLY